MARFFEAFIPAFLGTGVTFGVIYVLLMRALRLDRQKVEAWFEGQRLRMQSGRPVPILEKSQPVMLGALRAVYGRTAPARLIASFFVGLFITLGIAATLYYRYTLSSQMLQGKKAAVERIADPKLYEYVTDPRLRDVYRKSLEMEVVAVGKSGQPLRAPLYKGGIYDELRDRVQNYGPRLVDAISADPDRSALTLLFLVEGSYLEPGFQWKDVLFLFLFNAIVDFASVTICIGALRRLGFEPSFLRGLVIFGYAFCGTWACACVAFLSYRMFFRGDTGYFVQLFMLPASLAAFLGGVGNFAGLIRSMWSNLRSGVGIFHGLSDAESYDSGVSIIRLVKSNIWTGAEVFRGAEIEGLMISVLLIVVGLAGLDYVWSFWGHLSIGIAKWSDVFSFPYVLAGTTLIPGAVTLLAFGVVLAAKMVAEPARVLPEAYMTFVRQEVGSTQAAGLIVILGVIAGVIAGLISSAHN